MIVIYSLSPWFGLKLYIGNVNVCLRYMDMVWKLQQQQEMEIASNARGMMMRDHDAQFGYRVQPIQPNLQEKIMSLVID